MEEELIEGIKIAIVASEQANLFSSKGSESDIEAACLKFLRYKGYKIANPKQFSIRVKDTADLVKYFYLLLNAKHPENYMMSYNKGKDMALAKRFVESRMGATGASKEYALNECGEIIRTVLENEAEFNFKYDITFSLFGQENMKWVTDKALQLMNHKIREQEEVKEEDLRKKAIAAQDTSDLGFNDLDELLDRMEDEDGKEKRRF